MLMLLENKPCDDKNCQLYCLHLKKNYVTLCLHNMHSFNYKIWQRINQGAKHTSRILAYPARTCKELSSMSFSSWTALVMKEAVIHPALHTPETGSPWRNGKILTIQDECWLPPRDTHKQHYDRKLSSFPSRSAHLLSVPLVLKQQNKKSIRFYM